MSSSGKSTFSSHFLDTSLTPSHSLHDVARHPVTTPLVINLPACPVPDITDVDSYLPRFLHRYPSATIHYRWPGGRRLIQPAASSPPSAGQSPPPLPLRWPTPIHDTLAGYDHLLRAFTPPSPSSSPPPSPAHISSSSSKYHVRTRRDVYVVGSHLGAGLGAALALTESHVDQPMAVRGLLALDGVYNWTTFLPDHPISSQRAKLADDYEELGLRHQLSLLEEESWEEEDDGGRVVGLGMMKGLLGKLFEQPGNVFDPFASPALFFHTAGMLVPRDFGERWRPEYYYDTSSSSSSSSSTDDAYVYSDPDDPPQPPGHPENDASDAETNQDSDAEPKPDPRSAKKAPKRRGYHTFPPPGSTLMIPDALLLHSTPPPLPLLPPTAAVKPQRRAGLHRRLRRAENSFGSQAAGLAEMMRRSVNDFEPPDMSRWYDDAENFEDKGSRRVSLEDVGRMRRRDGLGFGEHGEEVARQWLEERLG